MSNVFDVDSLHVESDEGITSSVDVVGAIEISLVAPVEPSTVQVAVEGPQGPPGLQNVYVSETNPSATWGPEQENYIWIEVL